MENISHRFFLTFGWKFWRIFEKIKCWKWKTLIFKKVVYLETEYELTSSFEKFYKLRVGVGETFKKFLNIGKILKSFYRNFKNFWCVRTSFIKCTSFIIVFCAPWISYREGINEIRINGAKLSRVSEYRYLGQFNNNMDGVIRERISNAWKGFFGKTRYSWKVTWKLNEKLKFWKAV